MFEFCSMIVGRGSTGDRGQMVAGLRTGTGIRSEFVAQFAST